MRKLLIAALVGTLLTTQVNAICPKPAIKLAKGQKAPCAGVLFSPKKEKELRVGIEKHKITLDQLGVQNQMIEIYRKDNSTITEVIDKERKKAELWRIAAEDSTQKLIKSESGRSTRDRMFFILGILTVGAAAYGLSKIKR